MAESEFQIEPLVYAFTALRTHFLHQAHVYVASDMFLYFKEGDPRAVVAPDVFVVVGAPKHMRSSYKLWEELKAPDFVLEITSRSTRAEDQGRKREVCASLGVGEYWLFDPTGDWLAPRLQGLRLHEGEYRPLPSVALVNGGLSLHSEALGLEVRHDEDGRLRFHDPESGEDLLAHDEEVAARQATETRLGETEVRLHETQTRLDVEISQTVRRSRLDGPLARFTPAARKPKSRRRGGPRSGFRGTGRYDPAAAGPGPPSRTAPRCTGGRSPRRTSEHR